MGQLSNRLPTACGLALERGAGPRASPVVWLKRGASAVTVIRHACRGPQLPRLDKGAGMAVMIGIDPHKASHTAVVSLLN
jgi:hypothetical protein